MNDIDALLAALGGSDMAREWLTHIQPSITDEALSIRHGDYKKWLDTLDSLPLIKPSSVDLDRDCIKIGCAEEMNSAETQFFIEQLKIFHPWRKGPFSIFDVHIDTEWRSDWKWNRLKDAISPLEGKVVLDVGCGNAYYGFRMLAMGAKTVLGIDPTLLYLMQYRVIQRYVNANNLFMLPIGIDELPKDLLAYDTVFSMGVFYHRKSPIDHLLELKALLHPGGQLVLETLVVDGDAQHVLVPDNRYAQMRNVWFIPSCDAIQLWLQRCGYRNVKLVDVCKTSISEQRSTEWMTFQSLADFLDENNNNITVEGLPAPMRAVFTAEK